MAVAVAVVDRERQILGPAFFDRPVLEVSRDLLGRTLVREMDGRRLAGRIVETEAYGATRRGRVDRACHAWRGSTARNAVMFGPPGRVYVYLVYGMHHCLNLVCGPEGRAEAVLIRGIEPLEGEEAMARLRPGRPRREWTAGPGRLCAALDIDRKCSGAPLQPPGIWIEEGRPLPASRRIAGPRVGVAYAGEATAWPWRFHEKGNAFVSRGDGTRA